jgi:hypothetical protein
MTNRIDLNNLSNEQLIALLADIFDRLHTLEAVMLPKRPQIPEGFVPIKWSRDYGFDPETIRKRAAKGKISATRIGYKWYISKSDLESLAEKTFGNPSLEGGHE